MSVSVRPQPYRLDLGAVGSIADLQGRLPEVVTDADFMFQILFEDLKAVADGAITSIAASAVTGGQALTEVNDTNVTLTLGGSPTTALLAATSLTLGWAGQLAVARGGTGDGSFTAYSVICGGTTATGPLQNVSGVGTSGQILTSNGAGALPTWQTSSATGTVTHTGNLTANQLIIGNGTADITALGTLGTTTTVLHGNAGGAPTFAAVSLTADITGTLAEGHGGTNQTTYSTGDLLYASAANTLSKLAFVATATRYLANTGGSATIPAWDQVNLANGVTGNLGTTHLNSGTGASSSTFWRGDATWAAASVSSTTFGSVNNSVPQAWYRRWESWEAAPATTFSMGQTTINFANKSNVTDNGGSWSDLGSAVSGTLCDAADNSNFCQPEGDPTWRAHIRTDASNVTSQRIWGGLTQATAFQDTDSPSTTTGKCIAFRYSTVAGDTGFVGVTVDGTGQATTALIATIAANTEYTLEFVVSSTGTSVLFTVYDNNGASLGTPRTATTHIPTGTAVKSGVSFIPQTNAQRDLYIRGVYTESR